MKHAPKQTANETSKPATKPATKPLKLKSRRQRSGGLTPWLALLGFLIVLGMGLMLWQMLSAPAEPRVQTVSREGVVSRIQKLNRLETVAYNVDAVITSRKQGSWQRLWQDQQKALFVARGRVVAGVDLSKLGQEMVQVSEPSAEQIEAAKQQAAAQGNDDTPITLMPNILVTLPPSEIFSVYLDDIEVYDWQAGVFGMLKADPEILKQAQISAKQEVLERACRGEVMVQAEQNAKAQVQQLFALTGAEVTVATQGAGACQVAN